MDPCSLPDSRAARFRLWCRHNPAVAALAACVVLILVLNAVIATLMVCILDRAQLELENSESKRIIAEKRLGEALQKIEVLNTRPGRETD
jgi:hypothetical protein